MYQAIVCKIKTFEHPNADRIKLGNAYGFQVIISIGTEDGTLGLFFPTDGQLSEEFAKANDLVGYTDEDGNRKGGYFSNNRRVRAQKFRGEKSDGFWIPLKSLEFTGYDITKLKEGDNLAELNKIPICNKYFTPATLKALRNKNPKERKKNKCFAEHFDTKQFKYEINNIKEGSILYLTEKAHGTSGRFGYVLDEKEEPHNIFMRIVNLVLFKGFDKKKSSKEYNHLHGTRRVVLNESSVPGFYGSDEFREQVVEPLKNRLFKGEVLYYEIVGYTTTGAAIMGSHNVEQLKDKELKKKYGNHNNGNEMLYKYGCIDGTSDVYIYRITRTNEDGEIIDLPWAQVKKRCKLLGLKSVPDFAGPIIYDGDEDKLAEYVNTFVEGESTIDSSHIREGVAVRIEDENGISILKAKSHLFGILEGFVKDKEDYIDTEEIS